MAVERETILEELGKLIEEELGVDPSTLEPSTDLRDTLGMASLDAINIFMGVEERFGVEVSYEAIESVRTVQDAVDYFDRLINNRS